MEEDGVATLAPGATVMQPCQLCTCSIQAEGSTPTTRCRTYTVHTAQPAAPTASSSGGSSITLESYSSTNSDSEPRALPIIIMT